MRYERYYYMPMPVDKDGNGPAMGGDVAGVVHEVWDDACLTICTCADEATARHIAELLKASPLVAPQQPGATATDLPHMADVASYDDYFPDLEAA